MCYDDEDEGNLIPKKAHKPAKSEPKPAKKSAKGPARKLNRLQFGSKVGGKSKG